MPAFPTSDVPSVRRDLAGAIEDLQRHEDGRLTGTARLGEALVGPPGRLHGGMHACVRLLSILDSITPRPVERVRLQLDLLQPIRLGVPCPFSGRYSDGEDWRLETRFLDDARLDAVATPAAAPPPEMMARFSSLHKEDEPVFEIMALDTVRVCIGSKLVSAAAASPEALDEGTGVGRFITPEGKADAAWICVVLDLIAAVVQGIAWRSHVLTVRMDLSIATRVLDGPVLLLGDRQTRPDERVPLRPLNVGEEQRGARAVTVLLTDPGIEHAHAWGEISLYPSRHRLA
jgi:hypothetical protein